MCARAGKGRFSRAWLRTILEKIKLFYICFPTHTPTFYWLGATNCRESQIKVVNDKKKRILNFWLFMSLSIYFSQLNQFNTYFILTERSLYLTYHHWSQKSTEFIFKLSFSSESQLRSSVKNKTIQTNKKHCNCISFFLKKAHFVGYN